MNPQTPELIALCRLDEDGEDQLAGWAMVLPETEKVVAYVPDHTGVGAGGLLNTFSSLESAGLMLSYSDLYPATDLATPPRAPR
jgi:hypothetical protein